MNKFDHFFMSIADSAAKLSYAERRKVGAVAARDRDLLNFGYNGTLPGVDNTCENVWYEDGQRRTVTRDDVLHAEENLIIKAAANPTSLTGSTVYVTTAPCIKCARMLVAVGVKRVVWRDVYRETSGLDLLRSQNVVTEQYHTDI